MATFVTFLKQTQDLVLLITLFSNFIVFNLKFINFSKEFLYLERILYVLRLKLATLFSNILVCLQIIKMHLRNEIKIIKICYNLNNLKFISNFV